jgi:hypothetical protein
LGLRQEQVVADLLDAMQGNTATGPATRWRSLGVLLPAFALHIIKKNILK